MVDYFQAVLKQLAPQLILKCHRWLTVKKLTFFIIKNFFRKLNPKKRIDSVKEFANRGDKGAAMLTTDLLGRGVDLSCGVDLVIQFDPPRDAKLRDDRI